MSDDAPIKADAPAFDVVMLAGKTDDGRGTKVLRARPGRVEAGEVRPIKEGQPLVAGELVRLEPREDAPTLFNVHVQHTVKAPEAKTAHGGPPQVATSEFRASWERTFGRASKELN